MTLQSGAQTITIHIWANISRSKGNHTMKFGQLIEDKQLYIKHDGETILRSFCKKSKLSISLNQ